MEYVKLAIQVLDIIAWPAVALTAIAVFRDQIRSIMGRIATFEGLGFKASLNEAVRQAQEFVEDTQAAASLEAAAPVETSGVPKEVTIKAVDLEDIVRITQAFKQGYVVRIDLSATKPDIASQIVDMAAGMTLVFADATFKHRGSAVLEISKQPPPDKNPGDS